MRVVLLGEIAVYVGERRVGLGLDQPAKLLARLALSPSAISLDELGPLGNRNVTAELRKRIAGEDPQLGKELVRSPRGLRALADDVSVDVREFRTSVQAMEARMQEGDPAIPVSEVQALLDKALQTFLPGLRHQDHVQQDERFDDLRAEHVGRVSSFYERAIAWAQGRGDEALVQQWLKQWQLLGGDEARVERTAQRVADNEDINDVITPAVRARAAALRETSRRPAPPTTPGEPLARNFADVGDLHAPDAMHEGRSGKGVSEAPDRLRAVIVCALEVEYKAIRAGISDARRHTHRGANYEIGHLGTDWDVLIYEAGPGNARASAATTTALAYFEPHVAFFVGVAGGVKPPESVALGDVIVATKLYNYQAGKASKEFLPRPEPGGSDYIVLEAAKRVRQDEAWRDFVSGVTPSARVHLVPVASGDQVVVHHESAAARTFGSLYEDTHAVEMEGVGFLEAARQFPATRSAIIRGISDHLVDKVPASDRQWQPRAAAAAASLAFALLEALTATMRNDQPLVRDSRASSPSRASTARHRDDAEETDAAPAVSRTGYLNDLMRRASTLSFGDPAAWTVERAENVGLVTLKQVWTPLRVADSQTRVGKVGTHESMAENDAGVPLHELFAATEDHLLILGDPGSGKSSSVAMLAMDAAQAAMADANAPTPIWINLASVTGATKQAAERPEAFLISGVPEIASAVARDGDRAGLALARGLEKAMLERRALVLLDGLDEVKDHMLPGVRNAITQLALRPRAARVILTCRKFDYRQSAPSRKVPIERELELLPYSLSEMYMYVERWYKAAVQIGRFTAAEAASLSEGLRNELQNPDLTELGSLPLLLALLTLIHSEEAKLPDSRAVVSDRAIKYMLADAAKWRTREAGASTLASGPILALATAVAYAAHLEEETPADDKTDRITEQSVRQASASIARSIAAADRGHSGVDADTLAKRLLNSNGLLLHTGDGTYRFSHRYFQEYLAGQHFAQGAHHPEAIERGSSLHWREPFRLIASFAGQEGGNLFYIFTLIAALLDSSSLAARQLGAEMLAEIGRQRIALRQFNHVLGPPSPDDRTHGLWDRARDQMAAQVENPDLSLAERERSAAVLGYLGDSRLVDASRVPRQLSEVAVNVRGGTGRVGTTRISEEDMVGGWVGSIRELPFAPFRLGRYPVTNSQFAAFVDDNGYADPSNWEGELGRGWVSGDPGALKLIREHWLNTVYEHHAKEIRDGEIDVDRLEEEAQRRTAPRTSPYYWLDRRFNHPSQPVVGINWWEAAAYCVWATKQARTSGDISENEVVRLPTEFEWEHASRPENDDRIFPWGDSWSDEKAHVSTNTLNMRQPAPVGIYLEPWSGGPLDMAGNVWEWTLSLFLPYDEEFDAARIDHDSLDEKVVRGSSWYNFSLLAASGARAVDRSYNLFYDVGFRVGIFGLPD